MRSQRRWLDSGPDFYLQKEWSLTVPMTICMVFSKLLPCIKIGGLRKSALVVCAEDISEAQQIPGLYRPWRTHHSCWIQGQLHRMRPKLLGMFMHDELLHKPVLFGGEVINLGFTPRPTTEVGRTQCMYILRTPYPVPITTTGNYVPVCADPRWGCFPFLCAPCFCGCSPVRSMFMADKHHGSHPNFPMGRFVETYIVHTTPYIFRK